MEEAEIPLPSEETTPPVTKIYLVPIQFLRHLCFLGVSVGQAYLLHVPLSPQPARLSTRQPDPRPLAGSLPRDLLASRLSCLPAVALAKAGPPRLSCLS